MKLQVNYPLVKCVREPEEFRTPRNIFLKLLIFVLVFIVMTLAESIGMLIGVMPRFLDWLTTEAAANNGVISDTEATEMLNSMFLDPANTYIMLFSTGLATLVALLFCRVVEGRKLRTLGFRKKGGLVQYLIGLIVGFAMFSAVVGLSLLMGGLQWNGYVGGSVSAILLVLVGFGIQGMSEEVMCRGYLMTTVLRHQPVWLAVGVNSVIFGILHAFNDGFSLFALCNLILFAVTASLYVLRTDNLWGACAIHSIWNFVQGNFYGLPVSGIDSGDTIFSMSLKGPALANGGTFGLEASLPTTIVMLVTIAILLFVPNPFAKKTAETEEVSA